MSRNIVHQDEEASPVKEKYFTFPSAAEGAEMLSNDQIEYLDPNRDSKRARDAVFKGIAMVSLAGLVGFAGYSAFSGPDATSSVMSLNSLAKPATKPNFVFVLADDVAWNSFGYEDYDLTFATPYMTAMAKNGIVMSNYYTQEVCTPARASLMTGRYPSSVGLQYGEVRPSTDLALNIEETLLPEVLSESGYKNYAVGKWNLGHFNPQYLPTARGFDYFLGYMDGVNFYWSKKNPYTPQYLDFTYSDATCYNVYDGVDREDYSTTLYSNKAVDIIKAHDFEANPMFLYMAYQAAHDPFQDEGELHSEGVPESYVGSHRYNEVMNHVVGAKRQQYALSLMVLDDGVHQISEALEAVDQLDNTYIVVTSDNGGCHQAGGRSGPLRGSKGTLYEGGTKVGAFVYSPRLSAAAGTTYTGLMHVSDWFPTMLSWAGINRTPAEGFELDGVDQSLAMVVNEETSNPREILLYGIYANAEGQSFDIASNAPMAIRDKQYKLIHAYTQSPVSHWYQVHDEEGSDDQLGDLSTCSQEDALMGEYKKYLFDLLNDPFETNDLYHDEAYSQVKEALYDAVDRLVVRVASNGNEHGESQTQWNDNGVFVQPWNFDTRAASKAAPALCSKLDHVLSPKY